MMYSRVQTQAHKNQNKKSKINFDETTVNH